MDMISKKDLLAETGISYGQLYRWKRERLIPEEWFIKQSAFTGQETFFPKEQILDRIKSITRLKDSYSLEELAKVFDPETSASIPRDELKNIKEVDEVSREVALETLDNDLFSLIDVAFMAALSETAQKQELDEASKQKFFREALVASRSALTSETICTFFLAEGPLHVVFSKSDTLLSFDNGIQIVSSQELRDYISTLKLEYKDLFI